MPIQQRWVGIFNCGDGDEGAGRGTNGRFPFGPKSRSVDALALVVLDDNRLTALNLFGEGHRRAAV